MMRGRARSGYNWEDPAQIILRILWDISSGPEITGGLDCLAMWFNGQLYVVSWYLLPSLNSCRGAPKFSDISMPPIGVQITDTVALRLETVVATGNVANLDVRLAEAPKDSRHRIRSRER
jgi:hypothetical protein